MPKQRIWTRRIVMGCLLFIVLGCLGASTFAIVEREQVRQLGTLTRMIFTAPQYARLRSAEQTLNYLAHNSDNISLIAYSVDVEGNADLGQSHIFHNADTPRPLASTAKIVVLTAYAQAAAAGTIDSAETLTVAEWDQYHIPNTNGGAHIAALADLEIETDEWGYALDGEQTVTVDQLVRAMIFYSDNAAPEWLIGRLGYDSIQAVIDALDLSDALEILPHSGLLLMLQNHEREQLSAEYLETLAAMERAELIQLIWATQRRLIEDEQWGAAARAFWRGEQPPRDPQLEMDAMHMLSARGTSRDFATIMARVATDRLFSAEVSQTMRDYLEWPMEIEGNSAEFHAIGNKGGSLLGIVTDATYFTPRNGVYANQPRVVILLIQDAPLSAWLSFNARFAHQQFAFSVAQDAQFSEAVRDALDAED